MASADSFARVTGDCSDRIEMYLKIEKNRIKDASYFSDGCGSSNICGSFAAELAIGKDLEAVTDINGEAVVNDFRMMTGTARIWPPPPFKRR